MQRIGITGMVTAGLLLATGCASSDKGLMGYPKYRNPGAGKSTREVPPQQPPRILPETHYAAGRLFEQQGTLDKAIEQYRKAVALNHNFTAAYQRLGLTLSATGRHDEALEAFEKAVELNPDSAVLRNNLGFELLYQQRWAEAERNLREAVRIDPKLPRAHINLALLFSRTERFDEALESFRRALPEADAYYNLGLVLRAQKRNELAMDVFRHVLTLNPDFSAAKQQLAMMASQVVEARPDGDGAADQAKEKPDLQVHRTAPELPKPEGAPVDPKAEKGMPPKDEPGVAAEIPTATAEEFIEPTIPTVQEVVIVPAAEPALVPVIERPAVESRPMPSDAGWTLTLSEVARALDVVDNDRRCVEDEEYAALARNAAAVREAETPCTEYSPIEVASMIDPVTATDETQSIDDVVLVLPAAEAREIVDESTDPSGEERPTVVGNTETWQLLGELEASIEIIRNEVDCRKTEPVILGDAQEFETEQPVVRPASFEAGEDIQREPCESNEPTDRTFHWGESLGGLDDLLAVVRAQDECLAALAVAGQARSTYDVLSARLGVVPIPFAPIEALLMGPNPEVIDGCEPIGATAAQTGERVGLGLKK